MEVTATYAANPTTVRARSTRLCARGHRVVYPQGRTVVIRDLSVPGATLVYAEHAYPVTVARISPSGYYMASADASGRVRVWDLAGDEQMLKLEVQALGGRISDLAWDGESRRIAVGGEGRERFAHAFLADTGSAVGELGGHSKPVNAVALRPQRPFRAVTGGDDAHVTFSTGVPFKYARTLAEHTGFVYDVAYAPDGATFVTAGADGRVLVYAGTTGDVDGELCDGDAPAHTGSVFAVAFAPNGQRLVSAGADGAVKLWNVAQRALIGTWRADAGERVAGQQVGVAWGEQIVSLSLGGVLTVFSPTDLVRTDALVAPTLGITGLVALGPALYASSVDGYVYEYRGDGRVVRMNTPGGALRSVVALGVAGGRVLCAALDDTVRAVEDGHLGVPTSTTGQPRALAAHERATVVVTEQGVDVVIDGVRSHHTLAALGYGGAASATAAAVHPAGALVALGGDDARVRLYELPAMQLTGVLENGRSATTALAFSPDGTLLAAGESSGKIPVYDVASGALRLNQWVFHTARVQAIAWAPDGRHAASASL